MSKARDGGNRDWAKHLRKEGKRINSKGERRYIKRELLNWD